MTSYFQNIDHDYVLGKVVFNDIYIYDSNNSLKHVKQKFFVFVLRKPVVQ